MRFSLRTLLIGMTVVGFGLGWLGWQVQQARKQQKAVAWVQKMGGSVYYDYQFDFDGFFLRSGPPQPKWLTDLFGIDFFCQVTRVVLDGTQASDLTQLAGMKELRQLSLHDTPISDLTPLAGMKELRQLSLHRTPISDLTPLAGMKELRHINLNYTKVSDLTPLAGLTELEGLSINGTDISDITLLARMNKLKSIFLVGTQVSDVTPLAGMTQLRVLEDLRRNQRFSVQQSDQVCRHQRGLGFRSRCPKSASSGPMFGR